MPRDEFPKSVKLALAQRAGYLCSICHALTIGPSEESEDSVNLTGVAAHISAASPGGRRYVATMTPAERSRIDNGIWLCTTHSDLIDGDEVTYTIPYLKKIKKNHEERISLKQSGLSVENGAITKMELSNFGNIGTPITLEFANKNLIIGSNGAGKSLILELIASLSKSELLNRWMSRGGRKINSYVNIYFYKNALVKLSISIDANGKASYRVNNASIPILLPPIKILFFKESYGDFLRKKTKNEKEEKDNIELIAEFFQLRKSELINIILSIIADRKLFFQDVFLNEEQSDLNVRFESYPNIDVSFDQLSGGEMERLLLEIALRIVSYYSQFGFTLLLMENDGFGQIDNTGILHMLTFIGASELNIQFIFASTRMTFAGLDGYKTFELAKDGHEIKVKVLT